MTKQWQEYRKAARPLPDTNLSWPFHGFGIESLGVGGHPVREPMPTCADDEILVRVDALGLCASDAKMVKMGPDYPLFLDRDFSTDPTRLGHEIALTVIEVGRAWQAEYHPGQQLGLQPNVYVQGERQIFGVNISGGMTQYLTLGKELLAGDDGRYVLPVPDDLSYVNIALLEPWSCVDVAYTPVRRLEPKPGGVMWIRGNGAASRPFTMSHPIPSSRVVLTDVSSDFSAWVHSLPLEVIEECEANAEALVERQTGGRGFDDIILLDPHRADVVAEAVNALAPGGVLNLVANKPFDGRAPVDVGKLHYEQPAFVGCRGPDISAAYGRQRNRSELRAGGVTMIVGAGGSMGRMHTQRALEMDDGPRVVIAVNRSRARLQHLLQDLGPLADSKGRQLIGVSTEAEPDRLVREVSRISNGLGCDDIVINVPDLTAIEEALPHLADDGMLVVFAGLPTGNKATLPLDRVALHNAQFTGTSGSAVADEIRVLEKIQTGSLSPARSLAAIGGMNVTADGVQAVIDRTYPGKIVIFPQLPDLPLIGLSKLRESLPDIYACLGPDESWTPAAEQLLFERFLVL